MKLRMRPRRAALASVGVATAVAATLAVAPLHASATETKPAATASAAVESRAAAGITAPIGTYATPRPGTGSGQARPAGLSNPGIGFVLYAISPQHQRVMEYLNSPGKWRQIGGPAGHLYAGLGHLFATNPNTGNIYEFSGQPGLWYYVGGPGKVFVPGYGPDGKFALYGISPGGQRVMMWQLANNSWTQVGDAAGWLYSANNSNSEGGLNSGVYATNPNTGKLYFYQPSLRRWTLIGNAGRSFAGNGTTLYGLTPDGKTVMQWSGRPMDWSPVGTAAGQIYAGGAGKDSNILTCRIIATNPNNGDAYQHVEGRSGWERIGGPGQDFQIDGDGDVIGQNPSGLYDWRGGTTWENIGGPAAEMAVAQ